MVAAVYSSYFWNTNPNKYFLLAPGLGESTSGTTILHHGDGAKRRRKIKVMALLEVRNVSKHFLGLAALEKVNFEVREGEIKGLIGPNGAGKTTMFNVITGFLAATEGNIFFNGRNITHLKPHQLVKLGLTRTWQGNVLLKNETCLGNLLLAHHVHLGINWRGILVATKKVKSRESELRESCLELLELVGLSHSKEELAGQLPHGHQRALFICMALATRPRLLLLDEPVTGLNYEETLHMVNLIRKVHEEKRITMVVVEHNMKVIMGISDRIVVLDHGVKIAEGTPQEIAGNEIVIEAYLGSGFRTN